jgi:hypothetical protein
MSIVLPDFLNKFVKIIPQDQQNDVCDSIILLKGQEDIDQVCKLFIFHIGKKDYYSCFQTQDRVLQEITASGTVAKEFSYVPNPFTFENDGTSLAFVSNVDQQDQCIYMLPEFYMQCMDQFTGELE